MTYFAESNRNIFNNQSYVSDIYANKKGEMD